jgi:hypothetical protein
MRHIHPRVRELCEQLGVAYQPIKKKDHYFIEVKNKRIMVGNNGSYNKHNYMVQIEKEIRKAAGG